MIIILIIKKLSTSMEVKKMKITHALLPQMWNGTATLGNSLAVKKTPPPNTKCTSALQFSNCPPGHFSQRNKKKKYVHKCL